MARAYEEVRESAGSTETEETPATKAPANAALLQAGLKEVRRAAREGPEPTPSAESDLAECFTSMEPLVEALPDPYDSSFDWGKDLAADELSRFRELYKEAVQTLATTDLKRAENAKRLGFCVGNMARVVGRVQVEGSKWETLVGQLRPLAQTARDLTIQILGRN